MVPREAGFPEEGGKEAGLRLLEQVREQRKLSFQTPTGREIVSPDLYREEFRASGLIERVRHEVARLLDLPLTSIIELPEFPGKIEERFQACLQKYKGKTVMVRSNSRLEGDRHSYRGAYQSEKVENVDKRNLRVAFWKVYLSLNGPAALAYREKNQIEEEEDDMGIDVQPFQQGKFYGVMHTSRSDCPSALRITFSRTHGAVTDATNEASFTTEFVKTSQGLRPRYQTENWHELGASEDNWIHSLAKIGQELEKGIQHSEIEFVIGEQGEITLLQRDLLRNVSQVPNAVIPEFPGELLGKTYVCFSGQEVKNLPVVQIPNLDEELANIRRAQGINEHGLERDFIRGWIENVRKLDAAYHDGYVLVTTHFNETLFATHSKTAGMDETVTFDSLTPHKNVIFTTNNANPASHAATRARENSLVYVGFNRPELSEKISTGDRVSIYFIDGEAQVYREESVQELRDFSAMRHGENGIRIEGVYPHLVRNFGDAVARELSASGPSWSFQEDENEIGGTFICGERKIRISGNREFGTQTNLYFPFINTQERDLLTQVLEKIPKAST